MINPGLFLTPTAWSLRGGFPRDLCEWPQNSLWEPDCWEDGSRISWSRKVVLGTPAWFGFWGAGLRVHRPPQEWEETGEVQKWHPAGPSLGRPWWEVGSNQHFLLTDLVNQTASCESTSAPRVPALSWVTWCSGVEGSKAGSPRRGTSPRPRALRGFLEGGGC